MMLKTPLKTCLPFAPTRPCQRASSEIRSIWARASVLAVGISLLILGAGCQQAGAPGGSSGVAPITQLPGQAPMTGPAMPSLGPFGASARVPPPATGSYGNPAGQPSGAFNAAPANYAPANYAPANVQAMSYNETGGNNIAVAGGSQSLGPISQSAESGWMETSANQHAPMNPNMDLSVTPGGLRSGGMPVNDLTGAPPPPGYVGSIGFANQAGSFNTQPAPAPANTQGYQPPANLPGQYQATELSPYPNQGASGFAPAPQYPPAAQHAPAPQFNTPSTSMPISGGGFADSSPAANQPAFSTADRPVQWQTPRR